MKLVEVMPNMRGRSRSGIYDDLAKHPIGQIVCMEEGEDFEGAPEKFRSTLVQGMRSRGVKIRTSIGGDGNVYMQIAEKDDKEEEVVA